MKITHPELKKELFTLSLPKWMVDKIRESAVPNTTLVEVCIISTMVTWKAPVESVDHVASHKAFASINGAKIHIGSFPTELERDLAIFTCKEYCGVTSIDKIVEKIKKNWPEFFIHHASCNVSGVVTDLGVWPAEFERDLALLTHYNNCSYSLKARRLLIQMFMRTWPEFNLKCCG